MTTMRTSDRGGLDPQDDRSRVGWRNYLLGGRCTSLAGSVFVDARVAYSRISSEAYGLTRSR